MSVGELEAQGGKQLTAQDVKKLVSGATIEAHGKFHVAGAAIRRRRG